MGNCTSNPDRKEKFSSTFPKVIFVVQVLTFVAIAISSGVSAYNADREYRKERIERTYNLMKPLSDDGFISSLWVIEDYTICLEQQFTSNGSIHLAYIDPKSIASPGTNEENIAQNWWKVVEEEEFVYGKIEKPKNMERHLWRVYAGFSQLASCLETDLCVYDVYFHSIDSIDVVTFLGISNYLILDKRSRNWLLDPYLKKFIEKSFNHYAHYLDERRVKLQNRPVLCNNYEKRYEALR